MTTRWADRLVGRAGETAAFAAALDGLAGDPPQPRVLEICGEPGVGKSRLLDELTRLAAVRGIRTVTTRATEYERHVPFGAVTDVFGAIAAEGGLDPLSAVAVGVVTSAGGNTGQPEVSGTERYRLYRTLRQVLADAVPAAGAVLMLDDLHWADEASLELLDHLLHHPPHPRLLLALAYRTGQARPRLTAALAHGRLPVVRLAPAALTVVELADLAPQVPAHRRSALWTVSGGNPLYLEALSQVDQRSLLALADAAKAEAGALPAVLQQLLAAELDELDAAQRTVAHALAVAGDPAPLDVVVAVADRGEADVCERIDELVARGFIRGVGPRFGFRHPLVRVAAYQAAGPAWRLRAHRRAERYLQQRGGSLPMRAHHVARAADHGDRVAVELLAQAAAGSLDMAPATAAEWVRTALRILPSEADAAGHRAQLLLLLARALLFSGELTESREILHELIDMGGAERRVAVWYCVVTERLLGRLDEARALLEGELARPDLTAQDAGPLRVELAGVHLLQNDLDDCARSAVAARADSRRAGDRGHEAAAVALLGVAALHRGETGPARDHLDRAASLVDSLTDAELREHLHLLPPLAWLQLQLDRPDDATRHIDRGAAVARRSGRSNVLPYLYIVAAALAHRSGDLSRSRQLATDAVEASGLMGSAETLAMARAVELPGVLWQRGPEETLARAQRLARNRPRSRWWAEVADLATATVHLFAGQPLACIEVLAAAPPAPPAEPTAVAAPQWWGMVAMARAALGAHEEAIALAGRAVASAGVLGLPFQLGVAHHAHACVLASCGRPADAVTESQAAERNFSRAGAPVYAGLARQTVAEALAALGETARARIELGQAKVTYRQAEAEWLAVRAVRAETRVGAQGSRPRSAAQAPDPLAGLSDRERGIARLVAAGHTNREVAERLFLSPKTVEGHLSRIFAKLGVRSRSDVVRMVSAADGSGAPADPPDAWSP